MKDAKDIIPWKVTDIPLRPYDGFWTMNPSVHFDGKLWRCVLRCSDYAMPGGVTIRGSKARASGTQTKNAMVIIDPDTWQVARTYKMHERDGAPRVNCANVGYEDMRIFKTDRGGLQGIAASLHLDRGKMDVGRPQGATQNQPPEQVLISFDDEYNIVKAKPIRGISWSCKPQKNWAPFDHAEAPRFLYAIDRGTMFDENGAIDGTASATPSSSRVLQPAAAAMLSEMRERREREEREEREGRERREHEEREGRERAERENQDREKEERERAERNRRDPRHVIHGRSISRGAEIKFRGGRIAVAAGPVSRPAPRPSSKHSVPRADISGTSKHESSGQAKIVVSAGRALPPRYAGLRGGTQLVHVGDNKWLGIGHEMDFFQSKKRYWHAFYLTNEHGKVIRVSESMKFASTGIEFAAGMAIDGDRVVISFGTEDMNCHLAETSLSAVLTIMEAVE